MCLSDCVCRCVRVNMSLVSMRVCVLKTIHIIYCVHIYICRRVFDGML